MEPSRALCEFRLQKSTPVWHPGRSVNPNCPGRGTNRSQLIHTYFKSGPRPEATASERPRDWGWSWRRYTWVQACPWLPLGGLDIKKQDGRQVLHLQKGLLSPACRPLCLLSSGQKLSTPSVVRLAPAAPRGICFMVTSSRVRFLTCSPEL